MERKQWKNHGCSNNQQSTLFIPVLYMGIVDMTARLDSSAKSQNVCKQKNIESIILNSLTQTKITLFIYSWQDRGKTNGFWLKLLSGQVPALSARLYTAY